MYWQSQILHPLAKQTDEIENRIIEIKDKYPNWGYRPVHALLRQEGYTVNHKKTQRIIQKHGLQSTCYGRKSRAFSTYKGQVGKVAPNRLHRRFETCIPHQKIVTDTSQFTYYEIDNKGHKHTLRLYLDPFMDLYNREIISFSISKDAGLYSMVPALREAIDKTSDCKYRRTFHTDQGSLYQSAYYANELKKNRIFQSMSRKGNCHDNSVMENFFGLLKQEIYYGRDFYSYEELEEAIINYIRYYNEERIKRKLNWLSPVQFRLKSKAA